MFLPSQVYRRIGLVFTAAGVMLLLACLVQHFFGATIFAEPPAFPALGLVVVGGSLLVVAWAGEE